MNWTEKRLKYFADVTMGQSPKSEYYNNDKCGIPFLQGNRTFGEKYPSFDTYTTMITKKSKPKDVIMSVRAPVGDLNITPFETCLGRGVCAISMQNGNNEFLFYLMKHNLKKIVNRGNGTIFSSINKNDIENLEVLFTEDEDKQKRIAHILASIDDKIELNNKINDNLYA